MAAEGAAALVVPFCRAALGAGPEDAARNLFLQLFNYSVSH